MASIHFVSFSAVTQRAGQLHSDLASMRYRVLQPGHALARAGHRLGVVQLPNEAEARIEPSRLAADVVVFSKSLHPGNVALIAALRQLRSKVVVDLCDNYFEHAHHGARLAPLVGGMCRAADVVVTSTPALADEVRRHTGVQAQVITDAVEGPRGAARFEPGPDALRLLWFGHPSNWHTMAPVWNELLGFDDCRLELTVMSSPLPALRADLDAVQRDPRAAGRLSVGFEPWSTDALWAALQRCDVVIIPSVMNAFHAVKSPNRLAEAVWAGRAVVAHPLPAYRACAHGVWLDESMAGGLRALLRDRAVARARIEAGQATVDAAHSPAVVGDAWCRLVASMPAGRASA